MKRYVLIFLVSSLSLWNNCCVAQNNFFTSWENRVRSTIAEQPGWAVPVVTSTSGLVQLVRFDALHQYTPTHFETWNYGNSKGFDFIPFAKTEVDVNLPPFIFHNNPKVKDGAGDFSMVLKYRLAASNEKHQNYSISAQLQGVGATGSYKNGSLRDQINPSVIGGKGFGNFDLQSSIGALLPVGNVSKIGRTIVWNTVAQYKVGKMFWPELEMNANYYHQGPNDGKNQVFLMPGLMISKIKLRKDPKDRLAFVVGGGMQIATSHFYTYNHGLVLTSRVTF